MKIYIIIYLERRNNCIATYLLAFCFRKLLYVFKTNKQTNYLSKIDFKKCYLF